MWKKTNLWLDIYNHTVHRGGCSGTITANGNSTNTRCGTYFILEKLEEEDDESNRRDAETSDSKG